MNLATLDVFYEDNERAKKDGVITQYFCGSNVIYMYNGASVEEFLPHEVIHVTGNLHTRFVREDLDSILTAEYVNDNGKVNSYLNEVYLTEIIIELAGKDIVLEAFSKGDDEIFIQKMAEKVSRDEVMHLLDLFENYSTGNSSFFLVLEALIDYTQKIDLDASEEAYLYYCLGSTLMDDYRLPKLCYNGQKNQEYPKFTDPEEIISFFMDYNNLKTSGKVLKLKR